MLTPYQLIAIPVGTPLFAFRRSFALLSPPLVFSRI
jgi:hypothetical protein